MLFHISMYISEVRVSGWHLQCIFICVVCNFIAFDMCAINNSISE